MQASHYVKEDGKRGYKFSIPDGYVIPVLTKEVDSKPAESDAINVDKSIRNKEVRDLLRSGAFMNHTKLTLNFGRVVLVVIRSRWLFLGKNTGSAGFILYDCPS